jgi:cysteine synthase A
MVAETATIATCRALARQGLLLGGSSGTVLAGLASYASRIPAGACVVAISPDLGDRYADTIYNDDWVAAHYPDFFEAVRHAPSPHSDRLAVS